mmetsp:Transcript_75394/g.157137  ORF Transcript_75394/g.157137 Transcript_75394/m.157137 type:complete len:283 (+) Transcript_75394:3647-4495(+)
MVVEGGDGGVLDVVVAGNSAQSGDLDLARSLVVLDQVVLVQEHEGTVHQIDASLLQELVFFGFIGGDAVESRSVDHSHEEVGVAQPVHGVLSRLDGSQHKFGIEHVWQNGQQLGFDRQLLVVEGEVVLQLAVLSDDDAMTRLVILGSACSSNHLHHIHRRELVPGALLGVVDLSSLDDDGVRGQVDAPGQCGGGHEHLNVPIGVQILNELTIGSGKTGMMDGETIRQQIFQLLSLNAFDFGLQDFARGGVGLQELGQSVVLHRQVAERGRGFGSLLSGVNED